MGLISVQELRERLQNEESVHILDVREELEFHTFNIGGENIPLGKLPSVLEDLEWDSEEEIVVICQRGIRSDTACRILAQAGFSNIKNLVGGLLEWRKTA